MSTKYKATTTDEAYFITITTVGWIDVFTRLNQKYNIINALEYCQSGKNGQIDHHFPVQIDHRFRCKLTTQFQSKLTT